MKRIVGIAFGIAFGATAANGVGSVGGFSGMYLIVPGKLAERIAILREGSSSDSNSISYPMLPKDFDRLRNVADSNTYINVEGENASHSYLVRSGDEMNEIELLDRRTKMRNGRPQQ